MVENLQNIEIAKRIREKREDHQFTQEELAKAIGSHTNVIWQYENAKRCPTLENGVKLSKVLGIDLNYLMGLDDNDRKLDIDFYSVLSSAKAFFQSKEIASEQKHLMYEKISKLYWKSAKKET